MILYLAASFKQDKHEGVMRARDLFAYLFSPVINICMVAENCQ